MREMAAMLQQGLQRIAHLEQEVQRNTPLEEEVQLLRACMQKAFEMPRLPIASVRPHMKAATSISRCGADTNIDHTHVHHLANHFVVGKVASSLPLQCIKDTLSM